MQSKLERGRLAVLSWLLVATPLLAQTVRVVDRLGGGQYVDLVAAVAASSPGDTILIRNGGAWVQVDITIPLRIVAEAPAPTIALLRFTFANRPTRPVVIAGIQSFGITITGARNVVLEDIFAWGIIAVDTTSLLLVDTTCSGGPFLPTTAAAIDLQQTSATVVSSTITGGAGRCSPSSTGPLDGTPAIAIEDGVLLVSDSTLLGGDGDPLLFCGTAMPAPAVRGQSANVALTRSSLGGGSNGPLVAVELDSASTLVADPSTTLLGSATPTPVTRVVTNLLGSGVPAGQPASLTLEAPPQSLAFLAVASTALAPTQTPFGSLWIDLDGYFVTVLSGITDNAGQLVFGFTMPPLRVGTPLYFQAFVLPSAAPPGLSVPLATISR